MLFILFRQVQPAIKSAVTLVKYFRRKHISFVEVVTVMRINASYLLNAPPLGPLKLNRRPGRLLGHLRFVLHIFGALIRW